MKRILWIIVIAGIAGCAPSDYRRSADLQVGKLLKDREKQTLGYEPKAEAVVKTSDKPTRKSYEKVPTSPMPPPGPSPLEPLTARLSYGKLGPEQLFPEGTSSPGHKPLSIEEAREPSIERLRLGPPAQRMATTTFELFQAVEYAVQNSREYQSQTEDMYLAALEVTFARHLFEPRPFAGADMNYTGGQKDVEYRSALSITSSAGIRQQLPYGGEIVAQGLVGFVNALNDNVTDGESAQLALTATIPLLRDGGWVNLDALIATERQLIYQVRAFEQFRRAFVVQIASRYFQLLTQQQAIANRRYNYIVAAQLTEQSYAMYAAGRAGTNFLSVQRAQSQLFSSENSIISAEDNYQSSLDNFKILLGMPVDQPLIIVPMELDVVPPDTTGDVTQLALKYRLDLQTAADQVEDARRRVSVAENDLLPNLDFTAKGTIGNRDQSNIREIDARTLAYSAGLHLDLPVDRVGERNVYRRSLINLERAQRAFEQTRDLVITQVRDAVRSIRSAKASLDIQRQRLDLARRRLEYSNQLLVLGRATDSRDSVDAQNELLGAQDSYEQQWATYQIQILNFLRDTGTLRLNPDAGSLGEAMTLRPESRKQFEIPASN